MALRAAARPSAVGVCAMAAASSGWAAATRKMWPPEEENPQAASLEPSTPGSDAAKASAPSQSASYSLTAAALVALHVEVE
jgi:hypothetical protein